MTQPELQHVLEKTFLEVLEQHAFLLPDPAGAAVSEVIGGNSFADYAKVTMRAAGDMTGLFTMLLPMSVCREVESNLSGADDGTGEDAAKELMNIIGSNVLSAMIGPNARYDISIPDFTLCSGETCVDSGSANALACFLVDGLPVLFLWSGKVCT
jgi:hypothetical protein